MPSYNRVVLVGNLTRDIELKYLQSGTAVSNMGLAVNDRRKSNGQWVNEANFIDVTLWGKTAEVASQYLHKGDPVLIEGRLKTESWEKDGKKFSRLTVTGEKMEFLKPKSSGTSEQRPAPTPQGPPPSDDPF